VASGSSLLLAAQPARADVSSWLYVGAGPSSSWQQGTEQSRQLTLQLDTGLGTPPANDIIFGGLARLQPHFGLTTDFSLLLRTATHGYVNGDWGLVLDLGGYQRLTVREQGLEGSLGLGAPWGITLSVTGSAGRDETYLLSATLGIDLARLTVYRRTGETWWRNPFPAYRPEEE
jgi:hypothetical protein